MVRWLEKSLRILLRDSPCIPGTFACAAQYAGDESTYLILKRLDHMACIDVWADV